MQRNMDLIREILLVIEESDETPLGWITFSLPGRSNNEISYHVKLLYEAGLIEAIDASSMGPDGFDWKAKSLTWHGHEFLDAARDNTIWAKVKAKVAAAVGTTSVEVMLELLKQQAKGALGLGD